MDQNTWNAIDPQLDEIAEELGRILSSSEAKRLREMLVRFTGSLPSELSANLSCSVTVCDSEKEACLSLVNMGLGVSASRRLGVSAAGEVFPTSGDSTVHRYVVNGQIEVVPNDVCPKCQIAPQEGARG